MKTLLFCIVALVFLSSFAMGEGKSDAKAGSKVSLTFVDVMGNPARTQSLWEMIAAFEKENPNITISLISPPYEQAEQKLMLMLNAKEPIDIVEVRAVNVRQFVNNGFLTILDPWVQTWPDMKTLLPSMVEFGKVIDNKTYYIPSSTLSKAMFVRTDITKKLGITSQPKTVQELKDVCIKITNSKANQFGFALRGKNQVNAFFDPFVLCNIPNIDPNNIYRLKDGQLVFNHPAYLRGVKDWAELYEKGTPPDSVNWGWNEQIQGFVSGITPYLYQDPDTIPLLEQMQLTTDQYATFPMPVGSTGIHYLSMGPGGPGIPSYSKNKEAAWKFIAFSLKPELNAQMNKVYGALPVHSVSYEKDPYFSVGPYKAFETEFSDIARYPIVQYPWADTRSPGWRQVHDADMQAVLLHKMTPEDAVAKWAAYWK